MARTFAGYAAPEYAALVSVGLVVALAAVNYHGVHKTALATRVLVTLVLAALAALVAVVLAAGRVDGERLWPLDAAGPYEVLQSAGLLFFAFAGYARIATLGEEVLAPERTIPRAIPLALGIAFCVYGAVCATALAAAGAEALAASPAPLVTAAQAAGAPWLAPVLRVGAALASAGVLVSLIAGVSRTAFAMARNRDLPGWLAAVHPRFQSPHRAEVLAGLVVAVVASSVDLRGAIGFSSFAVLTYYGITNAAAWTLSPRERRWPRPLAALGLAGCAAMALSLPFTSVAAGAAVLLAGAVIWALRARRLRR